MGSFVVGAAVIVGYRDTVGDWEIVGFVETLGAFDAEIDGAVDGLSDGDIVGNG